jgi:hypothetical protein
MEEYNKKRLKGLIAFTGSMSMSLASNIGLFALICVLQGNNFTSVFFFIAGIMATTISYLIAVAGGVPLPGPKKRELTVGVPLPGSEISSVAGGVPLPPPKRRELWKEHFRFAVYMAIMLVSQIGLFVVIKGLQENSISLAAVTLLIAGIVGTAASYVAIVSGGVLPPGPKGWEVRPKVEK